MKKSRLVKRETDRLILDLEPEGEEWIEVKTQLTVREKRRFRRAGFDRMRSIGNEKDPQVEIRVDWEDVETARILEYVTDWSFVDHKEKPLKLNKEQLGNIDEEAFDAIVKALDEFVEEREQEKKLLSPTTGSESRLKRISS